jgi:hypothetical protein
MRIADRHMSLSGLSARKFAHVPLAITQSKTNRPYFVDKPGGAFEIVGAGISAISYTATIGVDLVLAAQDGILSTAGLAIDAVPEKFKVAAHVVRVGGAWCEKAAETAIVFTAAHVVSATKFGVILVQMTAAGVVSTKVPLSPQVYASAGAALAALPAADANNVAIGYIAIAADAGDWTANTDDMTNGSDLTTATFNNTAADILSCLTGSVAPVAMKRVAGTVHGTVARYRDNVGTKEIWAIVTTDGNAVIGSGLLDVVWRGVGSR